MKSTIKKFSSSQIIVLGFLFVIAIGTILLWLPISSKSCGYVPFSTALFTATTSTCVTGLVVVAIMSGLFIAFHKKIGLGNRLLLQDAFNLNTVSGLVRFTKKVLVGTFFIESIGALLYYEKNLCGFWTWKVWKNNCSGVSIKRRRSSCGRH